MSLNKFRIFLLLISNIFVNWQTISSLMTRYMFSNLSLKWRIVRRLVINWIRWGVTRWWRISTLISTCRWVRRLWWWVSIWRVLEMFLCELLLRILLLEVLLWVASGKCLYWVCWLSRVMCCCSRSGRCRLTCSYRNQES